MKELLAIFRKVNSMTENILITSALILMFVMGFATEKVLAKQSYHQGYKDASCDGWHEGFEYPVNGTVREEKCL